MAQLVPEEAARWPLFRLIGLVLIYVLGVARFVVSFGLPGDTIDYSLAGLLFMPSLARVILVPAIAWQIVVLLRSARQRPSTMVLYRDQNTTRELGYIGLGLFFVAFVPFGQSLPISTLEDGTFGLISTVMRAVVGLVPLYLVLVASRQNTTIDGVARRIVHLGVMPKVLSFDDVAGLGRLEVRMMRRGQQIGIRYYVALFPKSGAPIELCRVPELGALAATLQRIAETTGLPIAR